MVRSITYKTFLVLLVASLGLLHEVKSQPGTRDSNFNPDNGFGSTLPAQNEIRSIARQADGKFIIVEQDNSLFKLNRLNSDGTIDATFSASANGFVYDVKIQTDGRIIIAGSFTIINGTNVSGIARLMSDGAIDSSFSSGKGPEGGSSPYIISLLLQSDGKLIIGGGFTTYNGTSRNRIARINSDGTIDITFNPGAGADNTITNLMLRKNGKILLTGFFSTYDNVTRSNIIQINSDGSLDASFNAGSGTVGASIKDTAEQSDGRIIVAGTFINWFGTARNNVVRLNENGSIDLSFVPAFFGGGTLYDIEVQADDKIVLAGAIFQSSGSGNSGIARYNADGTFDSSFRPFLATNVSINKIIIVSNQIVVAGSFFNVNATIRKYIARINLDGTLDGGGGADNTIYSTTKLSNNALLIAGNFSWYDAFRKARIAKLNADGNVDNTFNPGTGPNGVVYTSTVVANEKIIIAGDFTSYNGTNINRIARLNTTGTLDGTFASGTGADGPILSMSVLNDGRLVIAGQFTMYNGIARKGIAVLQADGSLDNSFNPGTGVDGSINSIVIQDDKIVLGGSFSVYNGVNRNRLARINIDGSVDNSFDTSTGANATVYSVAMQADGKLLIGGLFTSFKNTSIKGVARINSDASIDASFTPGDVANDAVRTISVKVDGKIFIGGDFTGKIALLNPSGLLTEGWVVNPGPNGNVYSSFLSGENVIVAGAFNLYDNIEVGRIAKVVLSGKGNQIITFNALPAKTFGDIPFTLTATITSTLPITYASSNTSVATITNGMVTIVGAGTTAISASQTGDNRYNAAVSVARDLIVNKAAQTINFSSSIGDKFFDSPSFDLLVTNSSALPVNYSSTPAGLVSISEAGIVQIMGVGKVSITASQSGNTNFLIADPVTKTFCIKPTKPVIVSSFANPEAPVLTSNIPNNNQWYFGDIEISGATSKTLTVSKQGLYKVKVSTAECGSSEFSDGYSVLITGDISSQFQESIIYPNPSKDFVIVENAQPDSRIVIIDMKGVIQPTEYSVDNQNLKIDVRRLTNGNYIIKHQSISTISLTRFTKN